MITVISGTNREKSYSKVIADISCKYMRDQGIDHQLIDLATLPNSIFHGGVYGNAPEEFKPFQDKILNSDGILNIVAEYNGSFPGIMKYFIDVLKFPESLHGVPSAFVGVAAGQFGGIRAIEQLEMVFQYRESHIFGKRVMFPSIFKVISEDKTQITDERLKAKLETLIIEFNEFSNRLKN